MTTHLILTHLHESRGTAALAELRAFYAANPSQNVKERDAVQLLAAISDRKLVVLRDKAGDLRAACGIFAHGDGTFREVGGVRILDNGFGLQALLMSIAVAHEYAFDPPSEKLFAATARDNSPSLISIRRAGFERVADLGAARMSALQMSELDDKKEYFLLPEDSLSIAERNVAAVLSARQVERSGHVLHLDVQPPFTDLLNVISQKFCARG
jgi:hypothetical protein